MAYKATTAVFNFKPHNLLENFCQGKGSRLLMMSSMLGLFQDLFIFSTALTGILHFQFIREMKEDGNGPYTEAPGLMIKQDISHFSDHKNYTFNSKKVGSHQYILSNENNPFVPKVKPLSILHLYVTQSSLNPQNLWL